MATTTTAGLTPTIRFDEAAIRRLSTGGSSQKSVDSEFSDDDEHPQDWTTTTDEKDSWANRERRRSSVWSKIDTNTPFAEVPKSDERRGSILSLWSKGKDKFGNHILKHHDDEFDPNEVAIDDGNSEGRLSAQSSRKNTRSGSRSSRGSHGQERRPSILSMWASGKDEHGNTVMHHDDEEWDETINRPLSRSRTPEVVASPIISHSITSFIPHTTTQRNTQKNAQLGNFQAGYPL